MGRSSCPKTDDIPSDLPSQSRAYTRPIKDERSHDPKRLPSYCLSLRGNPRRSTPDAKIQKPLRLTSRTLFTRRFSPRFVKNPMVCVALALLETALPCNSPIRFAQMRPSRRCATHIFKDENPSSIAVIDGADPSYPGCLPMNLALHDARPAEPGWYRSDVWVLSTRPAGSMSWL